MWSMNERSIKSLTEQFFFQNLAHFFGTEKSSQAQKIRRKIKNGFPTLGQTKKKKRKNAS